MTIDNVKQVIKELESIEPDSPNAYEEAIKTFSKLEELPCFSTELKIKGECFFHSRPHDKGEEFFETVSDISIPPDCCVKNFGRCNIPGQGVFYCSESRPTSYLEFSESWVSKNPVGSILMMTIGGWKIKKNIRVAILTSPDPEDRVSEYDALHGFFLDKMLEKFQGEELEAYKEFLRYLFKKFREPAYGNTYIITSAFSNLIFDQEEQPVDAIYYPSVTALSHEGINLAINRKFIESSGIQLVRAMRDELRVNSSNDKIGKQVVQMNSVKARGISMSSDSIKWSLRTP